MTRVQRKVSVQQHHWYVISACNLHYSTHTPHYTYHNGMFHWYVVIPCRRACRISSVLQSFQVAVRMLDACSDAAAELQKRDFDRELFQQLRKETDQSATPVRGLCMCGHHAQEIPSTVIFLFVIQPFCAS